ncbi:MAG: hypothetical protein ACXACU_14015 [Candidatus Hodarchaeales archaeon]|jgi:hypothetical protein
MSKKNGSPSKDEGSDELLHHAEIKIDIFRKLVLNPSSTLRKFIQKESIDDKFINRFRPVMVMEESLDSLKKGAFTKLMEIECNNEFIAVNQKKGLDHDTLLDLYGIGYNKKINNINVKVRHKSFSDILAHARITERGNKEYRLRISFQGDLTKKELMKINNSLEAKFPSKESGSYKKLRYSTGGFTKGDKAALLGFGIVGVIVKRFLQKIGKFFRKK